MSNPMTVPKIFPTLCLIFMFLCMSCSSELQKYDFDDRIETTSLRYSNFLGDGHKLAYKDLRSGAMSQEIFDKIETEWIDLYTDRLTHQFFDGWKIYVWTKDICKDSDLIRLKQEYSGELQEEILIALNEGRLSMGLGKVDNEIGLMLTILPVNGNNPSTSRKELKKILIFNIYLEKTENIFEDIEDKNADETV